MYLFGKNFFFLWKKILFPAGQLYTRHQLEFPPLPLISCRGYHRNRDEGFWKIYILYVA